MRPLRSMLVGTALLVAGCTFSTVKPQLVAAPPTTAPRALIVGDVTSGNADWEPHRQAFRRSVVEWLRNNGGFESVGDERPASPTVGAVLLVGSVTEIDRGNAALRFLVGMGAGQAKV